MTLRRLLPLLILAMLGWSGAAAAEAQGRLSVSFGYYINPDGTGGLDVSVYGGPVGEVPSVSWEACPPAAACSAVTPRIGFSPSVLTGTATPGTVYVATVSYGSQTAKATSLPWLGLIEPATPPAIQGNLRVGGLVKPVSGTWSGGWGNEFSILQTQVCSTAGGAGCVVVADSHSWRKCPDAGAVLTYNFVGQYVRVVDERIGRSTPFTANLIGSPQSLNPAEPGPTATATVAGPIAAATGPPESTCGAPPPRVTLAKHAIRRGSRLEIGRIGCLLGCQVRVRLETCKVKAGISGCRALRPGEKKIRLAFTRKFQSGPNSGVLLVPYRHTRRIGPGTFAVNVAPVEGYATSGLVRVPRRVAKSLRRTRN
jgi:hypothetical protein